MSVAILAHQLQTCVLLAAECSRSARALVHRVPLSKELRAAEDTLNRLCLILASAQDVLQPLAAQVESAAYHRGAVHLLHRNTGQLFSIHKVEELLAVAGEEASKLIPVMVVKWDAENNPEHWIPLVPQSSLLKDL
jgi:hypothetical protein